MFYQKGHSIIANEVTVEKGINLNFSAHIHNSFEVIIAISGSMEATVAGKKYIISENECVFVFPNQLHEIKTEIQSEYVVLIFSPQLVMTFTKKIENYVPKSNKLYLDWIYIDKIKRLDINTTILEAKGLLYSICGNFDKNAAYIELKNDKHKLLFKIFNFVAENYKENCSLYELASEIDYNYSYLSQHFSKFTGISYTEYVNRFRINEACYLLTSTNHTVLDISHECGFDCLRSFNRSFKSIIGTSPSEYRQQKAVN